MRRARPPAVDFASFVRTRPGVAYPLGATWDGQGVNFALFSQHATGVDLCLFEPDGRESLRLPLKDLKAMGGDCLFALLQVEDSGPILGAAEFEL